MIFGIFLKRFWNCWICTGLVSFRFAITESAKAEKKETVYLLKVISQFDDRCRLEHPALVDDELPMLKRIDVALDEEKIRAAFHRQETTAGNVHTMCILEMLDRSACGCLKLNHGLTIIGSFRVDNDLEIHGLLFHDAFQG